MKRLASRRSIGRPTAEHLAALRAESGEQAKIATAMAAGRRASADHLRKRSNTTERPDHEPTGADSDRTDGGAPPGGEVHAPPAVSSQASGEAAAQLASSLDSPSLELAPSVRRLSLDDDKKLAASVRAAREMQAASAPGVDLAKPPPGALSSSDTSVGGTLLAPPGPQTDSALSQAMVPRAGKATMASAAVSGPAPASASSSCNHVWQRRQDGRGWTTGSCSAQPSVANSSTLPASAARTVEGFTLAQPASSPHEAPSAVILKAPLLTGMPLNVMQIPRRRTVVHGLSPDLSQLFVHGPGGGAVSIPFVAIDTTGNGQPDAMLADTDFDGHADSLVLDTTGDGAPDTAIACVCLDTDGDGTANVLLVDTNDDGNADTIIRIFGVHAISPAMPRCTSGPTRTDTDGFSSQAPGFNPDLAAGVRSGTAPPQSISSSDTPQSLTAQSRTAGYPPSHLTDQGAGPGILSAPATAQTHSSATGTTETGGQAMLLPLDEVDDVFSMLATTESGQMPHVSSTKGQSGSCNSELIGLTAPGSSGSTVAAPLPLQRSQNEQSAACSQVLSEASKLSSRGRAKFEGSSLLKQGWTPEEDETIVRMVQLTGQKWSFIAGALPGRTDDAVRNRYLRLQKKKSCNSADKPAVTSADLAECQATKKGDMWTPEEDARIMDGVSQHGFKWQTIARGLPGRSANAVRNRYLRCVPADGSSSAAAPAPTAYSWACGSKASASAQDVGTATACAPSESMSNLAELALPSLPADDLGGQGLFWDAAGLYGDAFESMPDDLFAQSNETTR